MAPMTAATPAQQVALEELQVAHQAIRASLSSLEHARDALNRESPAREVAIAITDAEGSELRVEKALRVLTSSVTFPLPPERAAELRAVAQRAMVTGRDLGGSA